MKTGTPDHEAYYFECPPITNLIKNERHFEFILKESKSLASKKPSRKYFKDYFGNCESQNTRDSYQTSLSTNFKSLSMDSELIAPCPLKSTTGDQYLSHLATFMREAPLKNVKDLWKRTATVMLKTMDKHPGKKFWLSTAGDAVPWLHVRVDQKPKYYNYRPYKQ